MKTLLFSLFFVAWVFIVEGQNTTSFWRGAFEVGDIRIPFRMELDSVSAERGLAVLVNGLRRDSFVFSREGDRLRIDLSMYDAEMWVQERSSEALWGEYIRHTASGQQVLPFAAYQPQAAKVEIAPTSCNLSGRWLFELSDQPQARLLLLEQNGNTLRGVVHAVTGDSRALEGEITGDSFYLSGFSGAKPVYLSGVLSGEQLQGVWGWEADQMRTFIGKKSEEEVLPDPHSLTWAKPGFEKLEFSFPDLEGLPVRLSDQRFRDKVVVIEILGSWCPNCIDQIRFLAPWYRENKARGVEIVGIGFELKDDLAFARKTLGRLREQLGIDYVLLFGGQANKALAAGKFPALSDVLAFPTTIIVDPKGNIRYIHTGFASEDTGPHYEAYVREFNRTIDLLLKESQSTLATKPDSF